MSEDYLDCLIDDVRSWDGARERSLQTAVGISELHGCRAYLGFRIRGTEETDIRDGWRATAGTSLHEWMTGVRAEAAIIRGEEVDFELAVSYRGVPGHSDEVNYSRGEVIDWKFPTKALAKVWDDPDVQAERFIQVHAYGAAVIATPKWKALAPDPANMTVRIVVAPVDGSFGDWTSYSMPLDVEAADEAVARFEEVQSLVAANLDLPRDKPWFWCSRYCEFFTACRGGGYGPAIRYPQITDEEVAAMVERYGQAVEQAREADQVKKALAPQLAGIRGAARGWQVRMSRPGQDRWVPDLEAIEQHYEQIDLPVPLTKKEGRAAYVIVDREKA